MEKLLLLLLLVLSTYYSVYAQPVPSFEHDGETLSIEARMAQEQTQGMALAVMRDGELIYHHQWGLRDREQQLPVDAQTVFQIGSMSQPITQFAVLQLVDQGIFDLDTDINTYLQSWKFPSNSITEARPITIRDLMLQRRGFKFPYKPDGYAAGADMPTHLQLLLGEKPAQNPPVKLKRDLNKKGNNSFACALVLQQLLVDHYQLPFAELMQQQVFGPLGMAHSFFAAEPSAEQQQNLAVGYTDKNERMPDGFLRFPELAASGMYCTAADYALFVQAIFDAINGETDAPISRALAEQALLPNDKEEALLFGRGSDIYFWGGATKGYYCQFDADAKTHRYISVAFMNDNLNWSFNREVRNWGMNFAKTKSTP